MKSKFQQRHYEAIASAMQKTKNDNTDGGYAWLRIRNALVIMFQDDNPNFNRDRFINACEPGANVKARKAA